MPTKRLTSAAVERLRAPEKGQIEYFDTILPGFALRISYAGSKSWIVMVRVAGKQKRRTLGKYPAMALGDARTAAREVIQKAQAGIDVAEEKRQAEAAKRRKQADTFGGRVEEFLKKHVEQNLRPRTVAEYQRVLRSRDFAGWNDRPISGIVRRDILDLLDGMVAKGTPFAARVTFSYLRKFLNWCVDREILDRSPAERIRPPGEIRSRERFLRSEEIVVIWNAVEQEETTMESFLKTLLLTGQRRTEVAGMSWAELIDLEKGAACWEIPGWRTKNGRPHIVPLSPFVAGLLRRQPKIGSHVFTFTGETPISGFSKLKKRLDRRIAEAQRLKGEADLPPWRLHDFRRTMITLCNEKLDFRSELVESAVNHISGASKSGVAGVYNRAQYLDQRRELFERWSEYVIALTHTE